MRSAIVSLLLVLLGSGRLWAVDHITLRHEGKEHSVSGEIVVTAQDGGILLLAADGTLWAVEPDNLASRRSDTAVFHPLTREELSKQLLAELSGNFEVYSTSHYLICYNTSREYATWCGALFERLYMAFNNYWTRQGLKLHESEFPLVAIIFGSRDAYVKHAQAELGATAESVIGYYSLRSNRITMYDLTGIDALRSPGDRRGSPAQINHMLERPEAEQSVATIVHEATHQIAFNSGLQTRFADIPLWVSEGLAVYFETPDLESTRGWRKIGTVNVNRLERFREYLPNRPAGSLKSLIADDKRIRDSKTALDAYAEAWALNFYLIRQKPKQYLAYLEMLSRKKPLLWDDPQTRLREFQNAFGDNLGQLETDFLRQMERVRY